MARHFLVLLCAALTLTAQAADRTPWHNKKCTVCLTYDDALNVHLDKVVPLLDSLGLKATFYVSGFFPSFRNRSTEWRTVAGRGHELGNHTLFHPCAGKSPGREWVKPEYDLSTYTIRRMADEVDMANVLLRAIDGHDGRTFAYPCGDTEVGDTSYVQEIKARFLAARGVDAKMQTIDDIDPYNIGAYMINGESGDGLVSLVREAIDKNALLVFLFHGVGGEHNLNVSLAAHSQLLHFLAAHEKDIWITPMIDIAAYLRTR